MPGQVEEIKTRLDIIDIVGEYIKLKPAGPNNWRALCPFHNEKTPSFMASKDKQIFHCFGCGEGGDIFTFVQKMEGIEFVEALRMLAQKAGVKLEVQDPKLASQRNRLMDICLVAQNFWHNELLEGKDGKIARDYLKKRKVADKTIIDFKLGYAVDTWDTLINFLKGKGFKEEEIFLAGLAVKKERGQGFYDRFRDRLMFPINDIYGNTIGFTGRTLKVDEKGGKYVNTPQTLIYNKSKILFGLDKAKAEIKKQDKIIIVEGQMDVITAHQNNFINVVASSGTALTVEQIQLAQRYTKNFFFALDSDKAGQLAISRGRDVVHDIDNIKIEQEDHSGKLRTYFDPMSYSINVHIIEIPSGKDPDEYIKNNPNEWARIVNHAKPIMEYYLHRLELEFDLSKIEDKKKAEYKFLVEITKIINNLERAHWIKKLADVLDSSEQDIREDFTKVLNQKSENRSHKTSSETSTQPAKNRDQMLSEQILAIALKYPINITHLIDTLNPDLIGDEQLQGLYKSLILYYTKSINSDVSNFDYSAFKVILKADNLDVIADQLVLLAEKDFFDFEQDMIREELFKAINFTKKNHYSSQLKKIEGRIKEAEDKDNSTEVDKLAEEFNEVIAQLNILD